MGLWTIEAKDFVQPKLATYNNDDDNTYVCYMVITLGPTWMKLGVYTPYPRSGRLIIPEIGNLNVKIIIMTENEY